MKLIKISTDMELSIHDFQMVIIQSRIENSENLLEMAVIFMST